MDLSFNVLHRAYRNGDLTPADVIDHLLSQPARPGLWITRLDRARIQPYLDGLEGHSPETRPLYGLPFAIKDNIDLAGVATTAGCPDFAYTPKENAYVVERLIAAGAIPLGKTTLDQFATGLVGERSPAAYGAPANSFDERFIPGGSSSGSAIAVATGQASFSLGTDTAGSGRVPASFNNLIGIKPTRGLLSTRGVVPACATLDTISIFALGADDGHDVLQQTAHYDDRCAWSRPHHFEAAGQRYGRPAPTFDFGVPPADQWETDGPHTAAMHTAMATLQRLGGRAREIDATPLLEAARLLYEGPWVTERYLAIRDLIDNAPASLLDVTHRIIAGGAKPSATDAFSARYRLAELKRAADEALTGMAFMLTPTVVRHPTRGEVAVDPIGVNSQLGRWTNFMNLLDYSAIAVPASLIDDMPQGVTLFSRAFDDLSLLGHARQLETHLALPLGATGRARAAAVEKPPQADGTVDLVVCGAHLEGCALNGQLTERGGRLIERTQSAATYRLFVLPGTPRRPAMVGDASHGCAIEVEIWRLPSAFLGSLLTRIGAPLGLGRVTLADGRERCGFIAAAGTLPAPETLTDISNYGGWRGWIAAGAPD
ncbi:allophanate hydrolase [Salinisphaera sp. Q1T1-3]|uniref:allophanate hydrolase n=1 Tax=Salinisphaera sp. Q1T1-3 TaxID=2321229 RepID=UPI000E739C58|nr:allophanate hydrolase [Salinisphaera sp. Q1T1-3]RJS94445.1 allophanate hydrolase [Salinisphaera sp. Q1T1-3]